MSDKSSASATLRRLVVAAFLLAPCLPANAQETMGLEQAEAVVQTLMSRAAAESDDPDAVRSDQSAWLAERDLACAENAAGDESNEDACRLHHTVERISEYEAALGIEDGLTSPAEPKRP